MRLKEDKVVEGKERICEVDRLLENRSNSWKAIHWKWRTEYSSSTKGRIIRENALDLLKTFSKIYQIGMIGDNEMA